MTVVIPEADLAFDRELRFGDFSYWLYFRCDNSWSEFLTKLSDVKAGFERKRLVSSYVIVADKGFPCEKTLAFYEKVASLGKPTGLLYISADEQSKTLSTIEQLSEDAADILDKSTCVISLGGGLVSNVSGLWAHLQFRGLPFVAVHTTVLGLQDVAPSLKQGVNNRRGKNQFGIYQAPAFVWGDVTLFDSLPALEIRAANCEAIKNVLTIRPDLYQELSNRLRPDAAYSYADYRWLTEFCLDAKSLVMRHDAHEELGALRLEYGHTCGHAFETIARRQQVGASLPHGIAIGLGMLVAARISVKMERMSWEDEVKHHALLIRNGVSPRIPEGIDIRDVLELMRHDNKRGYIAQREGTHPMILLETLGQPFRAPSGEVEMPTLVEERLIVEAISELQTA